MKQRFLKPRPAVIILLDGHKCAKIPLTQSQFAIIDYVDLDAIGKYRWCAHRKGLGRWYVMRREAGKLIPMHRQLTGFPNCEVDHANRNGLDNRRCNLRLATRAQNIHNTGLRKTNKSGFKGVHWVPTIKKWIAQISFGSKPHSKVIYLGCFSCAEAAAKAYDAAAIRRDKLFSFTNFEQRL